MGVLNSKLIIWVFRNEKNEFDDLFPKIRLEEFKRLPIPLPEFYNASISTVVAKILSKKQANVNADTDVLEAELDKLVYALYGLTKEEIALVEKG